MALIDFAGSPHGGKQKLLPEWQSQPYITPTLIIDHSIVGSASGAYYYFRDSTGIESHFILCGKPSGYDGQIWQLMDTARRADANNEANKCAISIETEDNGDPNNYPWSDKQLASLKWLHNTLVRYHPTIKRAEAKDCDGPGLGYHSKMGAPSCWTPAAGKTCPGKPVRVNQWNNILLPAFVSGSSGSGGDDELDSSEHRWLREIHQALQAEGTAGDLVKSMEILFARVRKVEDGIDLICENLGIPFNQVDTETIPGL